MTWNLSFSAFHLPQIVSDWIWFYPSMDHMDGMSVIYMPHPIFQLLKQSEQRAGAQGSLSSFPDTNKRRASEVGSAAWGYRRLLTLFLLCLVELFLVALTIISSRCIPYSLPMYWCIRGRKDGKLPWLFLPKGRRLLDGSKGPQWRCGLF